MYQPSLLLILALTVAPLSLPSFQTLTQTPPTIVISRERPRAPSTSPPRGKRKPGGKLGNPTSSCKDSQKQLMALTPLDTSQRKTTSAFPTFWFYAPYTTEQIRFGKFVLLTQDEQQYVYQTDFQLPNTPGVVSISLPSAPEYALEEGKVYRWYLELYCTSNTSKYPDLVVDEWIERIPSIPETERQVNATLPDIWYDSLTRVSNLYLATPQNAALKAEWTQLLKSAGLEEVAEEKVVGEVVNIKD